MCGKHFGGSLAVRGGPSAVDFGGGQSTARSAERRNGSQSAVEAIASERCARRATQRGSVRSLAQDADSQTPAVGHRYCPVALLREVGRRGGGFANRQAESRNHDVSRLR